MLTSMNIAAQLRRVARLKGKLRDVPVLEEEPTEELASVR
jgi:CHAD domain-containing protein